MKREKIVLDRLCNYLRPFEGKTAPSDADIARHMGSTEREAAALLADASDAVRIQINRRGAARSIVVFADRFDDSDEISRRIAGETATPVPAPASVTPLPRAGGADPQVGRPKSPAKPMAAAREAVVPKSPVRFAPPIGARPSTEWCMVADLKVDPGYQRSIDAEPSRKLIAAIAAGWDWRMCMPLVVSKRDDGLYVIDGQHRHAAAAMRGDIDQLPCAVSRYASIAEEAEMFIRMNRARRAINRLDDFHAALAAADMEAVMIRDLVEGVGFTIARSMGSQQWRPGDVAFTAAVAGVVRKHGTELVSVALQAMAEAFPDQVMTAGGAIFKALTRILVTPPAGLDRQRLFRAMTKYSAKGWAEFIEGMEGGTDRSTAMRDALLMAYDETPEEVA